MKTGMKAWVARRARDIEKRGKRNAAWFVFWNDPSGRRRQKSCGTGKEGWRLAQKEAQRIHGELVTGAYADHGNRTWDQFCDEYESNILPRLAVRSREIRLEALANFARIVRPAKGAAINTRTIDAYI